VLLRRFDGEVPRVAGESAKIVCAQGEKDMEPVHIENGERSRIEPKTSGRTAVETPGMAAASRRLHLWKGEGTLDAGITIMQALGIK